MNKAIGIEKSYLQVVVINTSAGEYALGMQELANGLWACDVISLSKDGNHSIVLTEDEELYEIHDAAAEGMRHVMAFVMMGGFDDEETTHPTIQ